ncbi:MAG: ABC transporter ATP-binding protein, partial [Acidimicrobiia bacterium]
MSAPAVLYSGVSFRYPDAPRAALRTLDLEVEAGEILLVAGASGSGKSTVLRAANGLVPHASGGQFSGDVVAFGRSTRTHRPRELADVVGFVHQDPEAQFVVDHVERDLAFVLENLGHTPQAMRRRVEEVLDALGIAQLRSRAPSSLSGGERQRCAIAGALAAAPTALVLDEPTSQLDPQGADDVLGAIGRLNADLGTTVLIAEHRLERAAPLADRAVIFDRGSMTGAPGSPSEILAGYAGAPPVTHLARLLGWEPLPLTVREARRLAAGSTAIPVGAPPVDPRNASARSGDIGEAPGELLLDATGITVELGGRSVLAGVSVSARRGEVVALLGRNGTGKTTLLRVLGRLLRPRAGAIRGPGTVAYVPQDPNTLLFAPSVRAELTQTLHLLGRSDHGEVDQWLDALDLTDLADRHPRSLAGGERQRVAVAAVAVGGADVLLLDEPTRGMDAPSRAGLERALHAHAAAGGAVVLATHDVELAARSASRAVVLGDGDVVASG